jgi:hypothetical protein
VSLARNWTTAICVASGPSLTDAQCALADEARRDGRAKIVVVNDNWRKLPDADVLYACDGPWYEMYAAAVRSGFRGECWTRMAVKEADGSYNAVERRHLEIVAGLPWLDCVPVLRDVGLPRNGAIPMGGNSGHQAIGLAYLFGARRILLIGYDMQRTGDRAHWHGDHPKPLTQGVPTSWIRRFDTIAAQAIERGVSIVNCTRETALTQFQRMDLREALAAETALC